MALDERRSARPAAPPSVLKFDAPAPATANARRAEASPVPAVPSLMASDSSAALAANATVVDSMLSKAIGHGERQAGREIDLRGESERLVRAGKAAATRATAGASARADSAMSTQTLAAAPAATAMRDAAPKAADVTRTLSISGVVMDGATGLPVQGAQVFVANDAHGTVTGADGRFTITGLAPGVLGISVRHIGYRSEQRVVQLAADTQREQAFALQASANNLSAVVVQPGGERLNRVERADKRAGGTAGAAAPGAVMGAADASSASDNRHSALVIAGCYALAFDQTVAGRMFAEKLPAQLMLETTELRWTEGAGAQARQLRGFKATEPGARASVTRFGRWTFDQREAQRPGAIVVGWFDRGIAAELHLAVTGDVLSGDATALGLKPGEAATSQVTLRRTTCDTR